MELGIRNWELGIGNWEFGGDPSEASGLFSLQPCHPERSEGTQNGIWDLGRGNDPNKNNPEGVTII
jgi:hypothetical protein